MSEESHNTRSVMTGLGLVCLLLAALDLAYEKHPHVVYEAWFNFYGFFAFVVSFGLVAAARFLKVAVSRDEDFYDG